MEAKKRRVIKVSFQKKYRVDYGYPLEYERKTINEDDSILFFGLEIETDAYYRKSGKENCYYDVLEIADNYIRKIEDAKISFFRGCKYDGSLKDGGAEFTTDILSKNYILSNKDIIMKSFEILSEITWKGTCGLHIHASSTDDSLRGKDINKFVRQNRYFFENLGGREFNNYCCDDIAEYHHSAVTINPGFNTIEYRFLSAAGSKYALWRRLLLVVALSDFFHGCAKKGMLFFRNL